MTDISAPSRSGFIHFCQRQYFRLYGWIASSRLRAGDLDPAVMHSHLVAVLATSMVMWAYTAVSFCTMSSPWPAVVGVLSSAVHLLSPLLFRWTANGLLVCSVMVASGLVHQTVFACFNGGYLSNILIWYAFLPSLAGVIAGRRAAILWFIITMLGGVVFLVLNLTDVRFPDALSDLGRIYAQALLVFGWITLSLVSILIHITAWERRGAEITRQKERVEDLFRALFHDLGPPLGSAAMGATALRSSSVAEAADGADTIDRSVTAMRDILGGARMLYALDHGLAEAAPPVARLDAVVSLLVPLIGEQLATKAIRLEIDQQSLINKQIAGDERVLVHHVLINVTINAIKFSRVGGVIHVSAADVGSGAVELTIRDEGVGMSPELKRTLFSNDGPQVRMGTAGERGSGFGLQLARAFLTRYGGDLLIESRDGAAGGAHGTTVRLLLRRIGNTVTPKPGGFQI